MNHPNIPTVIKIFTASQFAEFEEHGSFWGSDNDLQDGFIHLSTSEQVTAVKEKYFSDQDDVVLCHFYTEKLSADLKWEKSSSGNVYPHLYRELRLEEKIDNPDSLAKNSQSTKDSNGNVLQDGDSVSAIKDLKVKGAGSMVIKRGTIARNIRLTDDPKIIDGKVDKINLSLECQWFKKI